MNEFELTKWYMDIIDDTGRVFIGYDARLRWKRIKLHYSGFIFLSKYEKITHHNSFYNNTKISFHPNQLLWTTPLVKGEWKRIDTDVHETLINNENGIINWNCTFPKTRAKVQVKQEIIEGTGYCECLSMSIPPWKLPIKELRWGRYISEKHTIVWIEWRGHFPVNILYHNGIRQEGAVFDDSIISFGSFQIKFSESIELRSGDLLSTIFSKFGWLTKYFPLSVLRTKEMKWRSKTDIYRNGKLVEQNFAIHETVIWI